MDNIYSRIIVSSNEKDIHASTDNKETRETSTLLPHEKVEYIVADTVEM